MRIKSFIAAILGGLALMIAPAALAQESGEQPAASGEAAGAAGAAAGEAAGETAAQAGEQAAAASTQAPQQEIDGRPLPGQISFQEPGSEHARDIIWFDDFLLVIITAISVFVLGLLVYVIVRFNKKANPVPATFTHNAKIEVIWTAIPVIILVIIVVPSLRLLGDQLDPEDPDVIVKATANNWNWSYTYPMAGVEGVEGTDEIEISSYMLGVGALTAEEAEAELIEYGYTKDDFRLAVDNRLIVPVNKVIHVLVTSQGYQHAFALPAFGMKADALPGRTNRTWFKPEHTGIYYGQCSELCGPWHAYMPIVIEVVTWEEYEAYLAEEAVAQGVGGPVTDVAGIEAPASE